MRKVLLFISSYIRVETFIKGSSRPVGISIKLDEVNINLIELSIYS